MFERRSFIFKEIASLKQEAKDFAKQIKVNTLIFSLIYSFVNLLSRATFFVS